MRPACLFLLALLAAAAVPAAPANAAGAGARGAASTAAAAAGAPSPPPLPSRAKDLPRPTHSGYAPVGAANGGAELFYAFFEAEEPEGPLETTPIVLWLQVLRDVGGEGTALLLLLLAQRARRQRETLAAFAAAP